MAEDSEPTFLVDMSNRPIFVLIRGRANFHNCSPLKRFFQKMLEDGIVDFRLDFTDCLGMDSTFLGILAGAAIDAGRVNPAGEIQLTGLTDRNLDLVKNLGLHRIATLIEESLVGDAQNSGDVVGLETEKQSEAQQKEMLIDAHEDLGKIDKSNQSKFQDLLTILKNEE